MRSTFMLRCAARFHHANQLEILATHLPLHCAHHHKIREIPALQPTPIRYSLPFAKLPLHCTSRFPSYFGKPFRPMLSAALHAEAAFNRQQPRATKGVQDKRAQPNLHVAYASFSAARYATESLRYSFTLRTHCLLV